MSSHTETRLPLETGPKVSLVTLRRRTWTPWAHAPPGEAGARNDGLAYSVKQSFKVTRHSDVARAVWAVLSLIYSKTCSPGKGRWEPTAWPGATGTACQGAWRIEGAGGFAGDTAQSSGASQRSPWSTLLWGVWLEEGSPCTCACLSQGTAHQPRVPWPGPGLVCTRSPAAWRCCRPGVPGSLPVSCSLTFSSPVCPLSCVCVPCPLLDGSLRLFSLTWGASRGPGWRSRRPPHVPSVVPGRGWALTLHALHSGVRLSCSCNTDRQPKECYGDVERWWLNLSPGPGHGALWFVQTPV